jgi:hypothetical protein
MHNVGSHSAAAKAQRVITPATPHRYLNHAQYEERLRGRMRDITDFVENLSASTVTLLHAEKPPAREVLQEVVIKETALRWIARVAAVSTGKVRDRLRKDIEKALDDLELSVNLLERVDFAWPANQTLEFSDELAHIT